MKKILFSLITLFAFCNGIYAQCDVRVTTNLDTIICGDAATLNIFGKGQGAVVFSENFNSGSPSGWAFTQQATFTNPCSPNGVDGTKHIWMGNQSGVPRSLETNPYNFTTATSGATICFDMLFATQCQSCVAPCEGPDEPDEGVYLQYKIGSGPWVTIHYFDPKGGTDPQLINWNNWCFPLPQAALTSNVSIRWFQDADSGADYDHWGIDNVVIYFNDPTFTISIVDAQGNNVHSFPQGSSGGNAPPVAPRVTTTYTINMANTTGSTCSDSITIFVKDPQFEITAGNDTTVCLGQCVTLNSSAKVVKHYAKTVTFSNTQPTAITSTLGSATSVNVSVAGLNMTNVQPNSIKSVCITGLTYFGFAFPNPTTVGDLNVRLVCPDGTKILLIPAGVTTNAQGGGYTNTCFTAASTTNITSGSSPYSGDFMPNQPFNNLTSCSANGVWSIEVAPASATFIALGSFDGWSITFNDPEVSYNGNFSWSPTTEMTNPTSPTPTICPTATRDYVITVTDSAQCKTVHDTAKVTVLPQCCFFTISSAATQPSCGANNGQITITPSPAGNYTFAWGDGGSTSGSRTQLAAGTYTVTVTEVANGCTKDTTIILNSSSSLSLQTSNPVNPACGQANGSITVALSGGTAPYVVAVTVGGNTNTINVPVATTQTIPSLAAGTYTIVVTDAQQCQQTATVTLTAPNAPTVTSVTATTETCAGDNDATATVNATGTGTLTYLWSNGGTTSTISGLAPNTYSVVVTDANNCSATGSVTVTAGQPCCNINIASTVTQPACGQNDGSIALNVTPQGVYTYAWSAGGSTTETNSNLGAGTYRVTVTDASNCTKDTSFVLANPGAPTIDNTNATAETCAGNDGSATVTASGGVGTLSILWSNGATSFTADQLVAGAYTFTVTDGNGCAIAGTVTVGAATGCCNFNVVATPTDAGCGGRDGAIQVGFTTQGTAPYQYSLDGTNYQSSASFPMLTPGQYTVYVTDAQNCSGSATATVGAAVNPSVSLPNDTTMYENNPVLLSPVVVGNTNNATYTWQPSSGLSCYDCEKPVANPDDTTTYSLLFADANGCADSASITINVVKGAKIYMPNVFSPNGDGKNDILFPLGIGVKSVSWKVFNRWGELVFVTDNINVGWDGTFNGAPQPSGVYVYTMQVSFKNNTSNSYNGSVTLIR